MSELRKQGKGISGTIYDKDGNPDISVDDTIGDNKYQKNVNHKIKLANKQGRTIIEEESQEYPGRKHQAADLEGDMVHCPPGMTEVPSPSPK